MQKINELQLAKELIRFPSITPTDAGVMRFLEKKLKKLGFRTKILEFREKKSKPVKNLYDRLGNKTPNVEDLQLFENQINVEIGVCLN